MFGIADVYTVFYLVLGILIAFPGMIALVVFGLPKMSQRAQVRVEQTPWICFGLGTVVLGIGGLMSAGMMGAGGPLAAVGGAIAIIVTLFSLIGAAGTVLIIGRRMFGDTPTTPLRPVIMGALAYELAALFPIIGWVFILPILFILTTGAGIFAFLRWMPMRRTQPEMQIRVQEAA